MIESKIDLTNRLKREGRWGEASLFKDEKIKAQRAAGMHRPEAQAEAWEAMAEKFPHVEIPEPEGKEGLGADFTPEEIAGLPPGGLKNFALDASWVYDNLEEAADIESAPTSGSAGLLGWARSNVNDFFTKVLPRALQLLEEKPDSAEEAKQENLAHVKSLEERIGHLREDTSEQDNAIDELKAAKGFRKDDYPGFADYLRGLIAE